MRGERNGNDYLTEMKEKKERKKKKDPMAIFDKKAKKTRQKSSYKSNDDKVKKY